MKIPWIFKVLLIFIAVFLLALYWDGIASTCMRAWYSLTSASMESTVEEEKPMPDLTPLLPAQTMETQGPLTGDICAVLLFVDDENSYWTQEEAIAYTEKYVKPGVAFLEQQAASYGAELNLSTMIYTSNTNRVIYYDGNIEGGFVSREEDGKTLVYPDDTKRNLDIVERVAYNWGMDSVEALHQALLRQSGAQQIRFVVISNKSGWACANFARQTCYLYAKDHYAREAVETTFPHEFLHLFNAEDLYKSTRMDGTVHNQNRHEMMMQMHPNAIMNGGFTDIADGMVCGYTAYLVGWLDEMPPEYNCEDWWS